MVSQDEIHRMAHSEDVEERKKAVKQLQRDFADLPDKEQAWNDLLELTKDEDSSVRRRAFSALGSAFGHVTDKEEATNDLLALTKDKDSNVRSLAASSLGSVFQHVTDKQQVTNDLLALTKDENSYVRWGTLSALGSAFQHFTDKEQAWKDLLTLTKDENSEVRRRTAYVLGFAFKHVTDKEAATNDLLALTKDDDSEVRRQAAGLLGSAFQYVTDKDHAWKDLLALTKDDNDFVRWRAVSSLSFAFKHVTDKEEATNDLLTLTKDDDSEMQRGAASALGSAFPYVINKEEVWNILIKLSENDNDFVKSSASYSLGRIYILRATVAENDGIFKKELEKAIGFFEKSLEIGVFNSSAEFCLPFYRSFHAITFRKKDSEVEVEIDLQKAKHALRGSESRTKLFEVVKSLSNALKEVQNIHELDLETRQSKLKIFEQNIEHTNIILNATEKKAPIATGFAKRGASMIHDNIKQTITEIEKKAENLCREAKGTPYEELGKQANKVGKNLSNTNDLEEINIHIKTMGIIFKGICNKMPEQDRGEACELLELFNQELNVKNKLPLANTILSKVSSQLRESEIPQTKDSILNTPATVAALVLAFLSEVIDIFTSAGNNEKIIILVIAIWVFLMGIIKNFISKTEV